MKIIASVTKSSHQVRGPCYLHLPIFFLRKLSSAGKQKVFVIGVFLSILDHIPLFNDVYYEAILVWEDWINMINKRHILPIVYTMLIKIC